MSWDNAEWHQKIALVALWLCFATAGVVLAKVLIVVLGG